MDSDLIPTGYNYAQIDEQGYCYAKSTLSGIVEQEDLIFIDKETVELGQKYDRDNKVWLNEFKPKEPQVPMLTLEEVNTNVSETKEVAVSTEGTVELVSEDGLTNMELLSSILEKQDTNNQMLSAIMEHLNIKL